MGISEHVNPAMAEAVKVAVWFNYLRTDREFDDNIQQISKDVSPFTAGDTLHLVVDAIYAPEVFDSLNEQADDTIAEVLAQGVPVHLWMVGVPDIQKAKLAVVKKKTHDKLSVLKYSLSTSEAIIDENLHASISSYSKEEAFDSILERSKREGKRRLFVADDRVENLKYAERRGVDFGIEVQTYHVKKNVSNADFPACRRFLREWLGISSPSDAVVVLDVDDTVFNETGDNGRVSKIVNVLARNLVASPGGKCDFLK